MVILNAYQGGGGGVNDFIVVSWNLHIYTYKQRFWRNTLLHIYVASMKTLIILVITLGYEDLFAFLKKYSDPEIN